MSEPLRDRDGYSMAGAVQFAPAAARWIYASGEDDDTATTLNIVVQSPDDPERVKRYKVRIPISVDGHDLVVGEPEVTEL